MTLSAQRLKPLKGLESPTTRQLDRWLAPHAAHNAFNPSALQHDGRSYLAFRHVGEAGGTAMEASLLVETDADDPPALTNLTQQLSAHGLGVIADPKLLVLDGEVWLTFNDGWSATQNNLYLMKVTPEFGPPLRCLYSGRVSVEKNWAFWSSGGKISALYSVDPVRVLVAHYPTEEATEIVFSDREPLESPAPALGQLTIGTQLSFQGDRSFLVAHEKWRLGVWRTYLGRLVEIHNLEFEPKIRISSKRLFFSWRSLLGETPKHNKRLLSCTYFCGLSIEDDRALLSYGINDLHGGFSEVGLGEL